MSQIKPIATCREETCEGCDVALGVHCHFSLKDWLKFMTVAVPPLILGGIGLFRVGTGWGIGYLLVLVGFFGFLEIRVMCSHCPHYAEPGNTLRCWANYGSPKLWKYRPGPMSLIEHLLFLSGLALVYVSPIVVMAIIGYWVLLVVDTVAVVVFVMVLRARFCFQCMNFACTLNRTPPNVREAFFAKHPRVGEAWRHLY